MPAPYGQAANLAIAFQNSWGTAGSVNSFHAMELSTSDVGVDKEPIFSVNMRGKFEKGSTYEGKNQVTGNIQQEANPITLGVFLSAICGAPTSVNSGSIYTHTWQPRQTDFDQYAANNPFTLYQNLQDGGSASQFYDLVGNELELRIANGELTTVRMGVVGGNFSQVSSKGVSTPDGRAWSWDVTSVSIGGSGNERIEELTVTMTEALEAKWFLQSNRGKFPGRVKRTDVRELKVAGTMLFADQTEFQQFLGWDELAMVVHMKGVTEVQSGYTEDFTIRLPTMRYTSFKPVPSGAGQIMVGFEGEVEYNVGSGTALEFTLVNTFAAYL